MTEEELDHYLAQVPAAGQRLVRQARRESPVRQVHSRIGNVITRFVSRKMQRASLGKVAPLSCRRSCDMNMTRTSWSITRSP